MSDIIKGLVLVEHDGKQPDCASGANTTGFGGRRNHVEVLVAILLGLVVLWIVVGLLLGGPDLARYDLPPGERGGMRDQASPENQEALRLFWESQKTVTATSLKKRVGQIREALDRGFEGAPMTAEELGVEIRDVDAGGIPAEWVLAPDADPSRRLLYLHGGAFFSGSPLSHRPITARLSKLAGVAVLVIDYRLMPEHPRLAGIEDCRAAYRWILENGPEVAGSPREVFIAGDSAGGSLTLVLIAWIRDQGLRQVDAAVALSPSTDSTISSPSMRTNAATDAMLGPTFGKITRLPRTLVGLITLLTTKMRPTNPLISPVYGDLSALPPTLVHASETEMLLDDCRRYANKARIQGSDVRFRTWPGMMHVWQVFADIVPESNEALEQIASFIGEHSRG